MRTPFGETIVVLGASINPSRYSYVAVRELAGYGYHVIAVGGKKGRVGDIEIYDSLPDNLTAHTVTIYLNPDRQWSYEAWLLSGAVKRVIFNPGTGNMHLKRKLGDAGVNMITNCTLVMLSTGGF